MLDGAFDRYDRVTVVYHFKIVGRNFLKFSKTEFKFALEF